MILLCKALYRAFAVFVQSSLQVVCHAGVQDSISFVGQKVDIILFHILTAFLGVEFAEAFLLSERVLRDCHVGLRPPRNDKSGGQHCFNGGQYGSGVPSRDCHVASLLAMTNRGASTVLTAAGTDWKCAAGPGCPLPYGGLVKLSAFRFQVSTCRSPAFYFLCFANRNAPMRADRGTARITPTELAMACTISTEKNVPLMSWENDGSSDER